MTAPRACCRPGPWCRHRPCAWRSASVVCPWTDCAPARAVVLQRLTAFAPASCAAAAQRCGEEQPMNTRHLSALVLACAAVLASSSLFAQVRQITVVPQPVRQAPPPGVATFGLPNPAGLTPPDVPNLSSPGVAPGSPAIDKGIAAPTTVGGGGGVVVVQQAGASGANAMGFGGAAPGAYAAVDIARAFITADANHDG